MRNQNYDIFISHSSEENLFAIKLKDFVTNAFHGCRVFVSSSDFNVGESWKLRLSTIIKKSKVFIVIVNNNSEIKPWIAFECGMASILKREIIPIIINGSDSEKIINIISEYQSIKFETEKDLKIILSKLQKELTLTLVETNIDYDFWFRQFVIRDSFLTNVNIFTSEDSVYTDAANIVNRASKKIRITAFGDVKQNESESYRIYKDTLLNKLSSSKANGKPIELLGIYSSNHAHEKILEAYINKGVSNLVKFKKINLPRIINVLIIDNKYMHLSTPVLSVDKESFRQCIKIENHQIIENYISWFDEYLWNCAK